MRNTWRTVLGTAVAAALASVGCGTAPPGGGFTNGSDPAALKSAEKPSSRTDLKASSPSPGRDDSLAEGAASSPGGSGTNSGTGGRNNASSKAVLQGSESGGGQMSGVPPKIESSAANSVAGETKPAGEIKVGNPRSPQ